MAGVAVLANVVQASPILYRLCRVYDRMHSSFSSRSFKIVPFYHNPFGTTANIITEQEYRKSGYDGRKRKPYQGNVVRFAWRKMFYGEYRIWSEVSHQNRQRASVRDWDIHLDTRRILLPGTLYRTLAGQAPAPHIIWHTAIWYLLPIPFPHVCAHFLQCPQTAGYTEFLRPAYLLEFFLI